MSICDLLDKIKKGIDIYKKSDNIEFQSDLVELSEKIQQMQETITSLQQENAELKEAQRITPKIITHSETFFTIEGQPDDRRYCTTCWETKKKLIQLNCENGAFSCNECNNHGFYDREQYERSMEANDLVY